MLQYHCVAIGFKLSRHRIRRCITSLLAMHHRQCIISPKLTQAWGSCRQRVQAERSWRWSIHHAVTTMLMILQQLKACGLCRNHKPRTTIFQHLRWAEQTARARGGHKVDVAATGRYPPTGTPLETIVSLTIILVKDSHVRTAAQHQLRV